MAKIAVIETQKGTIKIQLFENKAPITTKNFVKLVERGFYNGLIFHRVEPGFVVQTGDPTGTGTSGSGETIPLEINETLTHKKGAVGMARKAEPDSASSQFYITLTDTPELDGNYAIFGQVISGMDVVEKIQKGDKILRIKIE